MARRSRRVTSGRPGASEFLDATAGGAPGLHDVDFVNQELSAAARSDWMSRGELSNVVAEYYGYPTREESLRFPAKVRFRFRPVSSVTKRLPVVRQLTGLYYRVPRRVRECISRKVRKGVLFAAKRIGFSGSSPGRYGRYIRRGSSQYRC